MLKYTRLILLTIVIFTFNDLSFSQVTGKEQPKAYKVPKVNVNTITFGEIANSKSTTGDIWWAYVATDKADSYKTPSREQKAHDLQFMDFLYIKDISGEFVKVARPKEDLVIDDIDLEDYGWVHYSDLLLWDHCLTSDNAAAISLKGMVINKIEFIKNKDKIDASPELDKSKLVPFYLDPQMTQKSGEVSQMFDILYIYKLYPENATMANATSVLLGKKSRITGKRTVKNDMMGWVPSSRITVWDHRVAVEMNSDMRAVEERKMNSTPVLIYGGNAEGKQKAIDYGAEWQNEIGTISSGKIKGYTYKGKFETERKQGTWMRFPVLEDDKDSKLFKLGVMGEVVTSQGKTIIPREQQAELLQQLGQLERNKRMVNIMFVIDGTSSMQPYFKALASTLNTTIDQIESMNPDNQLKYGAVVYRDAAEGSRLTEVSSLNASKEKVVSFLDQIKAVDNYDKDKPEAVYFGLQTALLSELKSDSATNILILIGDAGNHSQSTKTTVDENLLADLIAKKKCGFLAFQVHNEGDKTYQDFQDQVKRLMKKAADNVYVSNSASFKAIGKSYDPPKIDKIKNSYRMTNYPYMANITVCDSGQIMTTTQLQTEIQDLITFSQEYLEQLLTAISKWREGQSVAETTEEIAQEGPENVSSENKYVDSYAPGIISMLASMNVSNEMLENLKSERFQLYTEGYAPKILYGTSYPLFKSTLLLENIELLEILQDMEKLLDAAGSDDRRTALIDTWIELLKKYYGNIDEVDARKMSVEAIQAKVFGINPSGETLLGKYRLDEIGDPSVVDNTEINQYVRSITGKHQRLKNISNNKNYPYQFYINATTYYWIIEDDLP